MRPAGEGICTEKTKRGRISRRERGAQKKVGCDGVLARGRQLPARRRLYPLTAPRTTQGGGTKSWVVPEPRAGMLQLVCYLRGMRWRLLYLRLCLASASSTQRQGQGGVRCCVPADVHLGCASSPRDDSLADASRCSGPSRKRGLVLSPPVVRRASRPALHERCTRVSLQFARPARFMQPEFAARRYALRVGRKTNKLP